MKKNICGSCLKIGSKDCPMFPSIHVEAPNPACSNHTLGKYVSGDDELEAKPKANKAITQSGNKARCSVSGNHSANAESVAVIPLTPELLPPETNALTHSRTNELLPTYTPGQVTEQWGRARTAQWHAINESLKLGAMLIDVEKALVRETHKGGCFQKGDSLKAWLETNCPEVNYKTALRYRNAAEGLARQLGRANKVDGVQILIEADCREGCTPEANRSHELVEKAIDGRSMRQMLMDLWGEEATPQGGSREGSGRPAKSAEEKLDLDGEIARKIIQDNISQLREEVLHRRGWMRISDDRLETVRTLLKEVVTKMSDELERRGRAKKFGR